MTDQRTLKKIINQQREEIGLLSTANAQLEQKNVVLEAKVEYLKKLIKEASISQGEMKK